MESWERYLEKMNEDTRRICEERRKLNLQRKNRHSDKPSHSSLRSHHTSHRSSDADIAKPEKRGQSRSRHTSHSAHHANHSSHHSHQHRSHGDSHHRRTPHPIDSEESEEQNLSRKSGDRSRTKSQTESQSKSRISSHMPQSRTDSHQAQKLSHHSSRSSFHRSEHTSSHHSYHRSSKDSHSSSSKVASRNSSSSKKEKLPRFYEEEAYEWIEKMERYFRVQVIAERFKVDVAAKAMGEAADDWFQWWNFQKKEDSWEALKKDLIKDFPPKHRQKTGRTERKESSRARRTSSSPHSRTSSFSLQESTLSRQRKQESSRSSRTSRSQVYPSAPEISQSTKRTQMEPTEPMIKQVNKRDEIKEKRQDIHGPDYVYSNLAEGVDLTSNQVSIADKLIQPCSCGNRALIASKTVPVKSQLPLQVKEIFSEKLCIDKNRSGTEAQEEEEVGLLSGKSANIFGNHKPIHDADKSSCVKEMNWMNVLKSEMIYCHSFNTYLEGLKSLNKFDSFRCEGITSMMDNENGVGRLELVFSGTKCCSVLVFHHTGKVVQSMNRNSTKGVGDTLQEDKAILVAIEGLVASEENEKVKLEQGWKMARSFNGNGTVFLQGNQFRKFYMEDMLSCSLIKGTAAGSYIEEFASSTILVSGHRNHEELQKSEEIILDVECGKGTEPNEDSLTAARYWEGRGTRKRKRKQKIVAVSYHPP